MLRIWVEWFIFGKPARGCAFVGACAVGSWRGSGIWWVNAICGNMNVKQNFNAQGIDYEQIASRIVITNLIFSVTSRGEMNFR
jgi:hypothetical protein